MTNLNTKAGTNIENTGSGGDGYDEFCSSNDHTISANHTQLSSLR